MTEEPTVPYGWAFSFYKPTGLPLFEFCIYILLHYYRLFFVSVPDTLTPKSIILHMAHAEIYFQHILINWKLSLQLNTKKLRDATVV